MEAHHRRTIERVTELFQPDPRFVAVIIAGSVARCWSRPDSDVDIMMIATDEEYARRAAAEDHHYFNRDLCDYPGGYVDGKLIDMQFLRDAADHGSEPARAAFVGAFTAFSRDPEVDDLLARIPVYPEAEREQKIKAFYSQMMLLNWYVTEAEKRSDPYLLGHVVSELVLYGGRLILAHNRILFPYHKWFMRALLSAPDKPANFMELTGQLLHHPGSDTAQAFCDCVGSFQDWGVTFPQAVVRFMKDREWAWRYGRSDLAEW